jgi:hypothetical protein
MMSAKLSIGLLAALGVSVLLASALAQQPAVIVSEPPARGSADLFNLDAKPLTLNAKGYALDATPFLAQQVNPSGDYATSYTVANPATRNAESQLGRRAEELSRKLGGTKSESDRSEIKNELSQILEKAFDLRQKRHQEEIAGLEAKIKKLKDLVEKRQENRREIIAKKLDQILRDAEGLGW